MNSGIIYNVQIGSPTDAELRAQLQLLSQIAKEPTFNQLRTQEQLGYIVMSGMTEQAGSLNFRFLVQSEKKPDYVETRIEAFMDWLKEHLETLSEEDFDKQKASLIAKKEEKPKNLGEETQRFLGRITDKYYEFDRRESFVSAWYVYTDGLGEKEVASLRSTTKANVLDLFMKAIHPSSETRSKLSTHLVSTYSGVKFDMAAAEPLMGEFVKHGVPVDQTAIGALLAAKPDLQQVKDFALDLVSKAPLLGDEIKEGLKTMIGGLKGTEAAPESSSEVSVRSSNVFIEDIDKFKAGLKPSKPASPVEPLVVSAKL